MKMVHDARMAFRQQLERDREGNQRLITEARNGRPVPADILRDAERRLDECEKLLAAA